MPWLAYYPATLFICDGECHMLDQCEQPIPRLYGVCEITARSIVGDHYQYGLAVGSATTFGLCAGAQCAALDSWGGALASSSSSASGSASASGSKSGGAAAIKKAVQDALDQAAA